MGRLKLLGEHEVGGTAVDILEGDTSIVAGAAKLSFEATDFVVEDAGGGRANVALDYENGAMALADKTRPSPWVAAADLAARSIGDLGTRTHSLLAGLDANDHPQYARKAADEDISGLWQFSNTGILNVAGDLDVAKHMAVGSGATISDFQALKVFDTNSGAQQPAGIAVNIKSTYAAATYITGIFGYAVYQASGVLARPRGLNFSCYNYGSGAHIAGMDGILSVLLYMGAAAPDEVKGFNLKTSGAGGKPGTAYGVHIENMQATGTAYGVKIDEQSGTNKYLIEAGPATPNLRVHGGTPTGDDSKVEISIGGSLHMVRQGWHGSVSRIKLLPQDIQLAHNYANPYVRNDGGHIDPAYSANQYWSVCIPTGFKATYVCVYTQSTGAYVYVYEGQINTGTATSRGNGNTNAEIDITDVTASDTNYLTIRVAITAGDIYGGYVKIAKA